MEEIHAEKNIVAPDCARCMSPCGNTSDYAMHRIYDTEEETRTMKLQILAYLQNLATKEYDLQIKEKKQPSFYFFYKALIYVGCDLEKKNSGNFLKKLKGRNIMIRRIIHIDEEKCNGCGACASACHEGAIGMVNGKAKLLRDDYCDGLGDCLPTCPTGAITFVEREAKAYDEAAVFAAKSEKTPHSACQCPGLAVKSVERQDTPIVTAAQVSQLRQWPVQIKLAPVNASWLDGAKLLIAADCTAYAYANFHQDFIRGHITLVGCPKLDAEDYAVKLTQILHHNDIRSVTVVRMEVPCCGGIEFAVKKALQSSGKLIPWNVVTISTDGRILE